jgi:Uma2 family endonuclease
MAAAVEPLLMTVAQYRALPQREDLQQEIHGGLLVTVTRPKMKHAKLQSRLVRLLRPHCEHLGVVEMEVAFRALPEYELRAADVAFVSQPRWNSVDDDDNLHGSPELVIEVLSPSNTDLEMREKAALCLATGSAEFWIVDPESRSVTVVRPGQLGISYKTESSVPLALFSADSLPISEIFS